ncbi:hypothetical protein BDW22DRAFT_798105 [Trametopsis cervina]|nr:hypothetical protein BDW22DRAFT_798105 [Trametopsis cervina]
MTQARHLVITPEVAPFLLSPFVIVLLYCSALLSSSLCLFLLSRHAIVLLSRLPYPKVVRAQTPVVYIPGLHRS